MSKLPISQALELLDVSQATLYRDLKKGKLTFETNGKGRRVVDTAELERVYGQLKTPNGAARVSERAEAAEKVSDNPESVSSRESEKDRIITLLEDQLARAQEEKTKLLDMLAIEQEKTRLLMLPDSEHGKKQKKRGSWLGYFRLKR